VVSGWRLHIAATVSRQLLCECFKRLRIVGVLWRIVVLVALFVLNGFLAAVFGIVVVNASSQWATHIVLSSVCLPAASLQLS
jgi:hypothetical protein